jgi:hypothetical protein
LFTHQNNQHSGPHCQIHNFVTHIGLLFYSPEHSGDTATRWTVTSGMFLLDTKHMGNSPDIRSQWLVFHTGKQVKYAYQEWPHTEDAASPHSQQVERKKRTWVIK